MYKILCGHLLSFLWSEYLRVPLLHCVVGMGLDLDDTAAEFSGVVVPFPLLMGKKQNKTSIHLKLNLVSGESDYETINQAKRYFTLFFDLLKFGGEHGFVNKQIPGIRNNGSCLAFFFFFFALRKKVAEFSCIYPQEMILCACFPVGHMF